MYLNQKSLLGRFTKKIIRILQKMQKAILYARIRFTLNDFKQLRVFKNFFKKRVFQLQILFEILVLLYTTEKMRNYYSRKKQVKVFHYKLFSKNHIFSKINKTCIAYKDLHFYTRRHFKSNRS